MRPTRELFHHWARYRTITFRILKSLLRPILDEVEGSRLRRRFEWYPAAGGMCEPLWKHRE